MGNLINCCVYTSIIVDPFRNSLNRSHACSALKLIAVRMRMCIIGNFLTEYLEKQVPKIFVPLGRLSYTVFLSHTIIIQWHVLSQRTILPDALHFSSHVRRFSPFTVLRWILEYFNNLFSHNLFFSGLLLRGRCGTCVRIILHHTFGGRSSHSTSLQFDSELG